jgi:Rrf2 family protein
VTTLKISTKGRYALRMMIDLAEHKDEGFITLKDIAERQNISKKYLEQIVPLLNKSNILKTNRGYQGGYMLAQSPDKFTVWDILNFTEGNMSMVSCLETDDNTCPRNEYCMTLPIWKGLNKVVSDYLKGITLQDILDQYKKNDINVYII